VAEGQEGIAYWRYDATYGDQVVDVFYVTDQSGRKLEDETHLAEIRNRLLAVIESVREG
jgi:UTP:GlnB (protein PII) uridylyltransferase